MLQMKTRPRGSELLRYAAIAALIATVAGAGMVTCRSVAGSPREWQRIGRACHALGMQVLALRRRPDQPIPVEYPVQVFDPAMLHQLLPRAHALMIALPATLRPKGCSAAGAGAASAGAGAGQRRARRHRRPGCLVHCPDQRVIGRRRTGRLVRYPRGQAEWENTPPADYPFHTLDNVVLSPHRRR